MSSKSAVKFIAGDGALFRLVAILTGSKNALKGVGFFLGAALLVVDRLRRCAVVDGRHDRRRAGRDQRDARRGHRARQAQAAPAVDPVEVDGDQPALGCSILPVRLARHLVRRRAARSSSTTSSAGRTRASAPSSPPGSSATASSSRSHRGCCDARSRASTPRSAPPAPGRSCSASSRPRWPSAWPLDVAVTAVVVGGLIVFGVVFAINSSLHSYLILAYSARRRRRRSTSASTTPPTPQDAWSARCCPACSTCGAASRQRCGDRPRSSPSPGC